MKLIIYSSFMMVGGSSSVERRHVAVFGGGPAGLTTAHELAERGFIVDLYERHRILGGKVRSFPLPGTGINGRPDLPGNMGGHFFLASYPNLGHTLGRIPVHGGGSVLDNLTTGPGGLKLTLGWADGSARLPVPSGPTPLHALAEILRPDSLVQSLKLLSKLTIRDLVRLAGRSLTLATSGPQRAWEQLEHLTWHEYIGVDRMSVPAQRIMRILGPFGFENAAGANARGAWQLMSYQLGAVAGRRDHKFASSFTLLGGPENDAWIEPWRAHLQNLGVRFHLGSTLTDLAHVDGRIRSATVRQSEGNDSQVQADWYVLAVPPGKAAEILNDELTATDPALGRIGQLEEIRMFSVQILLRQKASGLRTLFTSLTAPWQTANEVLTSVWDMDLAGYGDGTAVEFVSVQVDDASWRHLTGMLYDKPAKDCTSSEIIDEVLAQLRRHLPDGENIFAPEAIHSVYFSPGVTLNGDTTVNVDEPLLACSASCWQNQPEPVTNVSNLFLAGSYTRNAFPGDTMESANESGKRAANAIIAAANSPAPQAHIASCTTPRLLRLLQQYDDRRYTAGKRNLFDLANQPPESKPLCVGQGDAT
jgi:uncharacterized protein with NAD-binding domain and iron-sulfur cluster